MPAAKIANLPLELRNEIMNRLLRGESERSVAKLAGVSCVCIHRYKDKVIRPGLDAAAKLQQVKELNSVDIQRSAEIGSVARQIIKSSPVREHLDGYRNRLETAMNRLEQIGAKPDATAAEIAAIGPVARAAHENLRILGELTGELGNARNGLSGDVNVSVYLNIPRGTRTDDDVIDVTCEPSE